MFSSFTINTFNFVKRPLLGSFEVFILKKNMKKTNYIKLRLNDLELKRIEEIQNLTQQKKSEVLREALYLLVLNRYPHLL